MDNCDQIYKRNTYHVNISLYLYNPLREKPEHSSAGECLPDMHRELGLASASQKNVNKNINKWKGEKSLLWTNLLFSFNHKNTPKGPHNYQIYG